MRRVKGFTLIELLIVIAIILILAAILIPSLALAKQKARTIVCMAALHDLNNALMCYASDHKRCFPPFAYSNNQGDLALSGHWGGVSQSADPDAFGRKGVSSVNLWALVDEGITPPAQLVCPCAPQSLLNGTASYFPRTFRFSTYCLRFPYSEDLFRGSPNLMNFGGDLLGIYKQTAGGQTKKVGMYQQTVPLVRADLSYVPSSALGCGNKEFLPMSDAVLADTFWLAMGNSQTPSSPGMVGYPVAATLCHGRMYNVAKGGGAVTTITDDGTVSANAAGQGNTNTSTGVTGAANAERIWQFFDGK